MSQRYETLTEREKETLRLILHGHDAKSMADTLGLSVHTVNEYLRNARRKFGVTSSKEAARCLFEEESSAPHFLGHKSLGDVRQYGGDQTDHQPNTGGRARIHRGRIVAGLVFMTIIFSALALAFLPGLSDSFQEAQSAEAAQESEAEQAAAAWLEFSDAGDWQAAYDSSASAFRTLNTAEQWRQVFAQARPPLGAALSRRLVSTEVTATPENYLIMKFETVFENRDEQSVETLTLVREDGVWKVVGVIID